MLLIVRGAALYITQGFPLKAWDQPGPLVTLLAGSFDFGPFRLYTSLWWFIGLTVLAVYLLDHAKLGNWISAIGSNRSAALARGVPADAVKIGLFMLTSVLAGLAGMISAFRISAASPVAGTGYELEVIAMVVVGGTALTGGRGTIFGTLVGALHAARDPQRHRADRRARPRLQHLRRRDHPGDAGAARAPPEGQGAET